jgi:WD40 repeat protein
VEIPNQHQFTAASWRDNETFTTLEGGVANIWSRSGQLVKPIPVTSPLPLAIGFLARGDGQELFTFAGDRQPVTWKIKEGSVKRDPPLEGRWLAATGDSVGTVLALSFDKSSVKIVPATGDSIVGTSFPGGFSIAVSDSGTMVATADFSGVVTIGRPTETSRVPVDNGGPLFGMAMSPNGDALACGLASGKVRLWKAVDGKELKMQELKMPPQSKEASAVAFAGASVAVGYADGSISIVDPEAGSEVPIILGSVAGTATGPVRSFAYQPRLNLLAVARDDKVVVVQLPGGRVLFSTEAYTDTRALAFDPLGRALAMLSRRGIFGLAPLDTNDLFAEVRGRIKKDWTPGEVKECQHLYSSVRPNICPPDMKLSPGGRKPGPGKPASGIGN